MNVLFNTCLKLDVAISFSKIFTEISSNKDTLAIKSIATNFFNA